MATQQMQTSNSEPQLDWPSDGLDDKIIQALLSTARAKPRAMQQAILGTYLRHPQSMILTAPSAHGTKLAANIIALQTALNERATLRKTFSKHVAKLIKDKNPTTAADSCMQPSVVIVCETKDQVETARIQISQLIDVGDMCLNVEAGSGYYHTKEPTPLFKSSKPSEENVDKVGAKIVAVYYPVDILIVTPRYLYQMIAQTKSALSGKGEKIKEGTIQPRVVSLKETRLAIWIDGKALADETGKALVSPESDANINTPLSMIKKELKTQERPCRHLILTDPLSEQVRSGFGQQLLQLSDKITPTLQWNNPDDFADQRKKVIKVETKIWSLMSGLRNALIGSDPKILHIPKFVALMAKDCQDDTVRVIFGDETKKDVASAVVNDAADQAGTALNPTTLAAPMEDTNEPTNVQQGQAQEGSPTQNGRAQESSSKQASATTAPSQDDKPMGIVIYASLKTFNACDPSGNLGKRVEGSSRTAKRYFDVLFENKPGHYACIRQIAKLLADKGLNVPEWMRAVAAKADADGAEKSNAKAEVDKIKTLTTETGGANEGVAGSDSPNKNKEEHPAAPTDGLATGGSPNPPASPTASPSPQSEEPAGAVVNQQPKPSHKPILGAAEDDKLNGEGQEATTQPHDSATTSPTNPEFLGNGASRDGEKKENDEKKKQLSETADRDNVE